MDKVQKSIISLLQGEGIFYASLLMQMNRIETKDLPEGALASVCVRNGRIELRTDCTRYEKLDLQDVIHILEHELLHVILEHGARAPAGYHIIWNMAADLAVNSLIRGMKIGLIPGKKPFEKIPVEKMAEFYYELLRNKEAKGTLVVINPGSSKGAGSVKIDGTVVKVPYCEASTKDSMGNTADATSLAKEVIRQAIQEANDYSTRTGGGPPGELAEIIKELLKGNNVNWKQILRHYVGNAVKAGKRYTWKRESRRFGETQKGKMPDRILTVAVAIDTSGSITSEDLAEFMTEIRGIMAAYKSKILIIEAETKVDRVYELRPHAKMNNKFIGRCGGTFVPVFDYFEKERKRKCPDVLVYFTDGYEEYPKETRIKTIWVRPSACEGDGFQSVPFGRLLQIPRRKQGR